MPLITNAEHFLDYLKNKNEYREAIEIHPNEAGCMDNYNESDVA